MPDCGQGSTMRQNRLSPNRTGFTLVELLVVIGIIALLISILLPALNRAKDHANRVACMSNIRQLTTGYRMYSDDNRGWLLLGWPDGTGGPQLPGLRPPTDFIPYFIGHGRTGGMNPPLTKQDNLGVVGGNTEEAIERGSLFKYAKTVKIYRCPSAPDQRLV